MGTVTTAQGTNAMIPAQFPNLVLASPAYKAGNGYVVGPVGCSRSSTNTNVMTTNKMYGVIGQINTPVTISQIGFRTSSSNASVGASVKFAIYNLDINLSPTTLVAQTTTGVAVTDSSVSTVFSATLSANAVLPAGNYMFCILPTAVTTGARFSTYASTSPWESMGGGTSLANVLNGTPVMGYIADAVYATGFPANFTDNSSATAITGLISSATNQLPILAFLAA